LIRFFYLYKKSGSAGANNNCEGYGPRVGSAAGVNYYTSTGVCTQFEYAGLYQVWQDGTRKKRK
jgi:hypothetical protein